MKTYLPPAEFHHCVEFTHNCHNNTRDVHPRDRGASCGRHIRVTITVNHTRYQSQSVPNTWYYAYFPSDPIIAVSLESAKKINQTWESKPGLPKHVAPFFAIPCILSHTTAASVAVYFLGQTSVKQTKQLWFMLLSFILNLVISWDSRAILTPCHV